jgi:hypothetical protein
VAVPSLPIEIAVEAETVDSGVENGDSEVEIVAAVGYLDVQSALGIENPADPDAIAQPWW